jgi:DNA-binding IclR family transcriptional regulator
MHIVEHVMETGAMVDAAEVDAAEVDAAEVGRAERGRVEGAETARRALRLIEAVVAASEAVPLADLAQSAGLSKSTCYRLARVLQDERYLRRAESGGYRMGDRLVGMAAAVLPRSELYAAARPMLRTLAEDAGETATLHMRSGDRAILVLGVESADHVLRRAATLGESRPLASGCSGRAILAQLDPSEVDPIIAGAPDPGELATALGRIRELGYAVSFGVNHPGVNGVAAPVLSTFGGPSTWISPLSVAVSGPSDRWTEQRIHAFTDRLLHSCEQLSTLFGPARATATRTLEGSA